MCTKVIIMLRCGEGMEKKVIALIAFLEFRTF
jgi:hypothetical protein